MDDQVIYDRQGSLSLGSLEHPIHIIGCGGVGTWAALMLAMAGVSHLHLYDNDLVEESNLNRLPYGPDAIGKEKIELLHNAVHALRPSIKTSLHGLFNPLLHKFMHRDRVICAVDTMRDRQAIYAACQEASAEYIDVGAESHTCTVSDSPADWSIVEDRQGYFTPVWVAPVVMAASLAVARVVSRAEGTLLADLSTETIRRTEDVTQEQEARGPVVGEPRTLTEILGAPVRYNPGEPIVYNPPGAGGNIGQHNDTQQPRVQRRRRAIHD